MQDAEQMRPRCRRVEPGFNLCDVSDRPTSWSRACLYACLPSVANVMRDMMRETRFVMMRLLQREGYGGKATKIERPTMTP
jgi:hypothetical protein